MNVIVTEVTGTGEPVADPRLRVLCALCGGRL